MEGWRTDRRRPCADALVLVDVGAVGFDVDGLEVLAVVEGGRAALWLE